MWKEPWLHAKTQALINKLNRSCTTLTISHDIMHLHSFYLFFFFFEGHKTVSFMLVIRDFIEMLLPGFRMNVHVHVEIKQISGSTATAAFSLSSQECDFLGSSCGSVSRTCSSRSKKIHLWDKTRAVTIPSMRKRRSSRNWQPSLTRYHHSTWSRSPELTVYFNFKFRSASL